MVRSETPVNPIQASDRMSLAEVLEVPAAGEGPTPLLLDLLEPVLLEAPSWAGMGEAPLPAGPKPRPD